MDFLKGGLNLDMLTGLLQNKIVIFAIVGIIVVFTLKGAFKKH